MVVTGRNGKGRGDGREAENGVSEKEKEWVPDRQLMILSNMV